MQKKQKPTQSGDTSTRQDFESALKKVSLRIEKPKSSPKPSKT